MLAKVFGVHLFSKLVASLTVLMESGLPVYFILNHRFKKLQEELFDTTLRVRPAVSHRWRSVLYCRSAS